MRFLGNVQIKNLLFLHLTRDYAHTNVSVTEFTYTNVFEYMGSKIILIGADLIRSYKLLRGLLQFVHNETNYISEEFFLLLFCFYVKSRKKFLITNEFLYSLWGGVYLFHAYLVLKQETGEF